MIRPMIALTLALAGCAPALPLAKFADTAPAFDPLAFFTGHVTSWGVTENGAGSPTGIVTTDCVGVADGPDSVAMTQRLTTEDGTTARQWHLRRTGPHAFEATANDMVGAAHGEAQGRAFHWTWTLATRPGQSWRNVEFEQWMYLMDGGAVVIRTTVTKLGITVARVTEQFAHAP